MDGRHVGGGGGGELMVPLGHEEDAVKALVARLTFTADSVRREAEESFDRRAGTESSSLMSGRHGSSSIEGFDHLIDVFEGALDEYSEHYGTVSSRLDLLHRTLDEDGGELQQQLCQLGRQFQTLFARFSQLEASFSRSRALADRSGRLIADAVREKRRAQESRELLSVFMEFYRGATSSQVLTSLLEGRARAVHGVELLRRLLVLGKSGIPGAEEAARNIEKVAITFERETLSAFHQAFEANDMDGMREHASLLTILNGGASCVQSFVGRHVFFQEPVEVSIIRTMYYQESLSSSQSSVGSSSRKASLISIVYDTATSRSLDSSFGSNSSFNQKLERVLVQLYAQVVDTVDADWAYLEAVFESPVSVMNVLLQRIFDEPLAKHVEEVLRQAKSHSLLAYQRTLFATYQNTALDDASSRLLSSASRHLNSAAATASSTSLCGRLLKSFTRHIRAIGSRANASVSSMDEEVKSVRLQLRDLSNQLFANHLANLAATEKTIMRSIYRAIIAPMKVAIEAIKSPSNGSGGGASTFLSIFGAGSGRSSAQEQAEKEMQEALSDPLISLLAFVGEEEESDVNMLSSAVMDTATPSAGGFYQSTDSHEKSLKRPLISATTEEDKKGSNAIPSTKVIARCLVVHGESARRIFLLARESERGSLLETHFKDLLDNVLLSYVQSSLDCCGSNSPLTRSSSDGDVDREGDFADFRHAETDLVIPIDLHLLKVYKGAVDVLCLVLLYARSQIVPLVVVSSTEHFRNVIQEKCNAAALVAHKLDALLRLQIDGMLLWIERVALMQQDKNDYRQPMDDPTKGTRACRLICAAVSRLADLIFEYVDEQNAAIVLEALGGGLFALLVAHLRRFVVSQDGAVTLQSDLKSYGRLLRHFGSVAGDRLRVRFEMLWELGNLFVVRPETLPSILSEGRHLSEIDTALLVPYLSLREDYASARLERLFPDLEQSFSKLKV